MDRSTLVQEINGCTHELMGFTLNVLLELNLGAKLHKKVSHNLRQLAFKSLEKFGGTKYIKLI